MSIKVHVEGGGDRRESLARCSRGFSSFFRKAGLDGQMPKIIACGSRRSAYERFRTALTSGNKGEFIILLVDSEASVAKGTGRWRHLKNRDGWDQPESTTDDNVHLMVECMEAWFLADKDCLKAFFGEDFNPGALPGNLNTGEVAKEDVLVGLKNATRQCRPKGEYGKGRHSFELLSRIDPAKVVAASPHAKRLIDTLQEKAS